MKQKSRVTILVKALPQPSKKHSETVCCAGISASGEWKRLFPVRFRHLGPNAGFTRWDIVEYEFERPRTDNRTESCRVFEDSITPVDRVTSAQKKANLVNPLIVASELEAAEKGASLAVIRPEDPELVWKSRTAAEIDRIRAAFEDQAKQASMFDKVLDTLEPCPYEIKMRFRDGDGKKREKLCGDWETSAAFFKLRNKYSEEAALRHLQDTYCRKYVEAGLVFALGDMASRPKTWQLLGMFPVQQTPQMDFF